MSKPALKKKLQNQLRMLKPFNEVYPPLDAKRVQKLDSSQLRTLAQDLAREVSQMRNWAAFCEVTDRWIDKNPKPGREFYKLIRIAESLLEPRVRVSMMVCIPKEMRAASAYLMKGVRELRRLADAKELIEKARMAKLN